MSDFDTLFRFCEKAIELSSFALQDYTPIRGKLPGEVFEHKSGQVPQMYSRVHFCPHSITHMDLPWCLDQSELKEAKAIGWKRNVPLNPTEIADLLDHYSMIRFLDTIVLDLSNKAKIMKSRYLDETGFIHRDLSTIAFDKMMDFLEIKRDRDILALASAYDIKRKFLIIRTGWDNLFNLWSTNLDNPFFELRHPYLVYPFFSYSTVKWLVEDLEIEGIGCETPGCDNPAYYTTPHFAPQYAKKYLYYRLQPKFRPTSVLLLTSSCYYIKHMTNLELLEKAGHLGTQKCFGKVCIIPISLGMRDANLAKVLFWKEE